MEKIRAIFLSGLPIEIRGSSLIISPLFSRPSSVSSYPPAPIRKWPLLALFILSLAFIFTSPVVSAELVRDYAVEVSATVQTSPAAQIKLVWPADSRANGYTIYRKPLTATGWTQIGSIPPASAPAAASYIDPQAVGSAFEYWVRKTASGYNGHGYVYAGIEAPATESRGKLVLMVDKTYTLPLASELTRLAGDLTGDGWQVLRRDVDRTATVPTVKNIIKTEYDADPAR